MDNKVDRLFMDSMGNKHILSLILSNRGPEYSVEIILDGNFCNELRFPANVDENFMNTLFGVSITSEKRCITEGEYVFSVPKNAKVKSIHFDFDTKYESNVDEKIERDELFKKNKDKFMREILNTAVKNKVNDNAENENDRSDESELFLDQSSFFDTVDPLDDDEILEKLSGMFCIYNPDDQIKYLHLIKNVLSYTMENRMMSFNRSDMSGRIPVPGDIKRSGEYVTRVLNWLVRNGFADINREGTNKEYQYLIKMDFYDIFTKTKN